MKIIMMAIVSCLYASSLFASTPLSFDTKTISESNAEPKYEIKIQYPQIHSPSSIAEKQFNEATKKWASDKAAEFKKSLSGWNTEQLPPELKANGSTLTVNYTLTTLDPKKIISLRFSSDNYFVGAAHPSHVYNAINYDLTKNKKLMLADLFAPNSEYLEQIAKISSNKVKAKLNSTANGTVDIFKEGLLPTSKNYEVWNLTPRGIRFTFNEYQVAAYVFGPQEIIIPYNTLKSFLAENTPLFDCVANNNCTLTVQKVPAIPKVNI